jgi:regulator of RNase E activity RraA
VLGGCLLVLLTAGLAGLLRDPSHVDTAARLLPHSAAHPLGTVCLVGWTPRPLHRAVLRRESTFAGAKLGSNSPDGYGQRGPRELTDVVETPDIVRPPAELSAALATIGSATASAELSRMGIRSAFIRGPVSVTPGVRVAGPALTLQFLPKREDRYPADEYAEPEKQLHRHVMYHARPGDMIVVDARGDMSSGVFGEMMLTYFKGRGGAGVVIDGCLRDIGEAKRLGLGLWIRGATPNFHAQTDIVPTAVNVPVACGGTLVEPGDIVVADDDGAVVVPIKLAPTLLAVAQEHAEWEEFSRIRLAEGGDMRLYYPLSDEARPEYERWRAEQGPA